jgi:2-methylisocitrate lyase-like PEP mutase family enzyme
MTQSAANKRATFRKLHEQGCFVMPNPWDVGSARALAHLGFKAVASTSAGFAWSIGKSDNRVTLEDVLKHLSDSTGDKDKPLYERAFAIERIKAARAAIDAEKSGVLLTGRCEGFLVGQTDLTMVIDRLTAYSEAGADCLYAPGIKTKEEVAAVVKAVHPKPVNLLIGTPFMTVAEAADLGVRRISVGGSLARVAWAGFLKTAREIAEQGSLAGLGTGHPGGELNKMFTS